MQSLCDKGPRHGCGQQVDLIEGDDAVEYQLAFLCRLHKVVESQTAGSISSLESSDEVVYYKALLTLEETSILVLQVNSNVLTDSQLLKMKDADIKLNALNDRRIEILGCGSITLDTSPFLSLPSSF